MQLPRGAPHELRPERRSCQFAGPLAKVWRHSCKVIGLSGRPSESVKDLERVEVVAPSGDFPLIDGEYRDVAVGVGGTGCHDLALGRVFEHDCAGLSVVMDGEVEAPIQREFMSVWAVELRHCGATDNVPWIVRHGDDVVELDVLGQEVKEVRPRR
jgi:hypothetical protein